MRRALVLAALLLAGCDHADPDQAADKAARALNKAKDKAAQGAKQGYARAHDGVRSGADRAGDALRKAGDKARRGYDKAKARVDAIDWVEAFASTRTRVEQASRALQPSDEPAPADAWWTRGAEAVRCEENTCTVAAWFVTQARAEPTRMMGDVKVLTALDDSGWLLDNVRPGSAAAAMGFRKGDVIRTIAGRPLTDGLARLEILAKLRKASQVDTTFVRAGQTEVSTLTIRFETAPAPH